MSDMDDREILESIRAIVADSEARVMERISDAFGTISVNDQHCRTRHETVDRSIATLETVISAIKASEIQKPQLWQGWGAISGIFIGLIALLVAWFKK